MRRSTVRISLLVLLTTGILVLSLLPKPPMSKSIFAGMDKVQHWLAYATLGFLMYLTLLRPGSSRLLGFAATVLVCTLYGGLIEVLQGLTGRNSELADFFVNMFGAASGGIMSLGFLQIWGDNRQSRKMRRRR